MVKRLRPGVRAVPGIPGMTVRVTKREIDGGVPLEHTEAVRFMRVVRLHEAGHPLLFLLHHIPNGGLRHKVVAAKMKAEGAREGVPDYFWPVRSVCGRYPGLYVEMKRQKGSSLSPAQVKFMAGVKGQGFRVERADGWEHAWRLVCEHGGIPYRVQ